MCICVQAKQMVAYLEEAFPDGYTPVPGVMSTTTHISFYI